MRKRVNSILHPHRHGISVAHGLPVDSSRNKARLCVRDERAVDADVADDEQHRPGVVLGDHSLLGGESTGQIRGDGNCDGLMGRKHAGASNPGYRTRTDGNNRCMDLLNNGAARAVVDYTQLYIHKLQRSYL